MDWILSRAIYCLVSLLNLTYRYRFTGSENLTEARRLGTSGGYILAIWHQSLFHGITAQSGTPHVVIISKSKDANPVAYTCARRGNVVVRGSSRSRRGVDKGGKLAKEEMIDLLRTGMPGAVTIDGPTGPAREAKAGIVNMSRQSGAPIVPYVLIPDRFWSFNSWDRFRLPKPFAKILVSYGRPILVDEDAGEVSFQIYQAELKKALDEEELKLPDEFPNWKILSKVNDLG